MEGLLLVKVLLSHRWKVVWESGVGSDGGMIHHPSLAQRVFALLLCNKVVLKRHLLAIISSGAVTFCCARKRNKVGKSDFKP